MEKLSKITNFLNNYLNTEEVEDKSWNGLQVEGKKQVEKIAFCVTAGEEVFKKVLKENPDLIIVHHGIFWKEANPSLKGWMKKRITPLIENNVSLYASHLPLDRHKKVGNNAQLLETIGSSPEEEFGEIKGKNIGWIGEKDPIKLPYIVDKLEKALDRECKVLDYGNKKVNRVGVISGSGGSYIYEGVKKDLDLFVTGEETEIAEVAKDVKMNVIFGGHYATETLGVKALKRKIEEKFSVKTVFLDFPTGL